MGQPCHANAPLQCKKCLGSLTGASLILLPLTVKTACNSCMQPPHVLQGMHCSWSPLKGKAASRLSSKALPSPTFT